MARLLFSNTFIGHFKHMRRHDRVINMLEYLVKHTPYLLVYGMLVVKIGVLERLSR